MRIISSRRGHECDHSTRDYGYISGIKVYYDYGVFDMGVAIPYNTEIFNLIKKYKDIDAEKKFNKITINLRLYCEDFNEEEDDYVELALEIREALINRDMEVIQIINTYHGQKDNFSRIKAESALGKKLQKVLTASW